MKPALPPILLLLFAGLCANLLPAQRTWIVDKNGGPGVDFLDLAPAHYAAAPGDTILLRPLGNHPIPYYSGPDFFAKPLTIRGDDVQPVAVRMGSLLEDAPAGLPYIFDNIYFTLYGFLLRRCAAQIVFTRCTQSGSNINAIDCANVVFEDCILYKFPRSFMPIQWIRSNVTVVRCELRGAAEGAPGGQRGQTLLLEGSHVELVDTIVTGGNVRSNLFYRPNADSGVNMIDSSLWLRGTTEVHAGRDMGNFGGGSGFAVSAVPPSVVVVDPSVQFFGPSWGRWGPNYFQGVFVLTTELTHVSPGPAQQGASQTVDVVGPQGSNVVLLASPLSGHPPIELPLGNVYLVPEALIPVGTAAVDPLRRASFTVQVPASAPSGLCLTYQAVSLSATGALQIGSHAVSIVE